MTKAIHRASARRTPAPRVLLAACGAALVGALVLCDELNATIIGKDDRVRIEERGPTWDAIGQVNIGGYRSVGQCTGTLVAPDIVITAAHCVVDDWKAAPYPLHDIHFLAGLNRGKYLAHATAKCLRFLPGYVAPAKALSAREAREFASLKEAGTDVVAIVLNEKLDIAPVQIAKSATAAPGLWLTYAGYPADRRYMLSAHVGCRLVDIGHEPPLWLHDCDTQPASSGGPVLTKVDGQLQLAAVNIASGSDINFAVPIAGQVDLARDDGCPQ